MPSRVVTEMADYDFESMTPEDHQRVLATIRAKAKGKISPEDAEFTQAYADWKRGKQSEPKPPKVQDPDWAAMSPAQRAQLDEVVLKLDKAKSAGGGSGGYIRDREDIRAIGGVDPVQATAISRYVKWKQTTGGDPNWQGPINMNSGAREPKPDMDKRMKDFYSGDPKKRAEAVAESKLQSDRKYSETLYDDLVDPEKLKEVAAK